jgi:anaerobic dimethyl sulfoxide reductase subunit A
MSAKQKKMGEEKVVKTACSSHCGGRCLLEVHVRDGVITRIETDRGEEPQLRACLRCRAYRQRVYDPDRLQFPMRRTGERGEGLFERISWDEALDTIVSELNRVRSTYGPSAVLLLGGGGDASQLHTSRLLGGLLAMTGGYTDKWGIQSFEGGLFASLATYGTLSSHNAFDDLLNSRLIIMWGWNPVTTIHETNTNWYLLQAKESGTKIISVDPRYTDSTAVLASQWIPIRPGTDTAVLIAMAYVMIAEDLFDKSFLDTYTVGFERFRAYVAGDEDGIPKTPVWAETISGVPAQDIENLAREYATTKPAALVAGIGPGRSAYGEQYHRAVKTLAAMTGNIGIHGGWSGRSSVPQWQFGGYDFKLGKLPDGGGNPVERGVPPRTDALPTLKGSDSSARIHAAEIADAILKGRAGGYPADIKMALVMHTNPVNQYPNTNKMVQALRKLEFLAVAEQVMSATAKFADIVLPVSTFLERDDIIVGGVRPFYGFVKKVIEPLYESRSPLEICQGLASRLGISLYAGKTDDDWLRTMVAGSFVPDYDTLKEKAIYRIKSAEPHVAFKEQIEDPEQHPFPTPSGKIEIYSQWLDAMNSPEIPPIPTYIEPWEGRRDPLAVKYPLQLITTHFKRRAHTQFDRVPWLRELMPQAISINTRDAEARGIRDGDKVRVFNERGEILIQAKVTERIMPGVVDLPQGAWYDPDEQGVDRGGCANVLTRDKRSPGGAACHNTGLVEVAKVDEGKP